MSPLYRLWPLNRWFLSDHLHVIIRSEVGEPSNPGPTRSPGLLSSSNLRPRLVCPGSLTSTTTSLRTSLDAASPLSLADSTAYTDTAVTFFTAPSPPSFPRLLATMASIASRALRRPAATRRLLALPIRPLSTTVARRAIDDTSSAELGVGELQGAKFKIEPLRRVGEDDATKRARLVCMSFPPRRCRH